MLTRLRTQLLSVLIVGAVVLGYLASIVQLTGFGG